MWRRLEGEGMFVRKYIRISFGWVEMQCNLGVKFLNC